MHSRRDLHLNFSHKTGKSEKKIIIIIRKQNAHYVSGGWGIGNECQLISCRNPAKYQLADDNYDGD